MRYLGALLCLLGLTAGLPAQELEDSDILEKFQEIQADESIQWDLRGEPPELAETEEDDQSRDTRGGLVGSILGEIGLIIRWMFVFVLTVIVSIWMLSSIPGVQLQLPHWKHFVSQEVTAATEGESIPRVTSRDRQIRLGKNLRVFLARQDYDSAVHVLLLGAIAGLRNLEQQNIADYLTGRELLHSIEVPEDERKLFALLVQQVERSLFGHQELLETDFRRCHQAYMELAPSWRLEAL